MSTEKVILLASGGLNSAVTLSMAAKEHHVYLMHVRYGNRAELREQECFERLADHYQIGERQIVDMPHFAAIGGNGRVSRKMQIEDALAMREGEANYSYVPGLIGSLLHAAISWAATIGATKVYLGVCEDLGPPAPKTCTLFPDYSREYIQLCNHLSSVVSPSRPLTIETPLIDLSRTEIIKLGGRLETPFEWTWSCLSSGTQSCGACVGCATRNRGFLDSAIPDPVFLQTVSK